MASLLAGHLDEPSSSWSVGEFGVLAEFHHTHPRRSRIDAHTVVADGGAMRVGPPGVKPIVAARILAYETPSPNPRLWNHGVAFCLPEDVALMDCRAGVTELGRDHDAIFATARHETLFDLGLGRRTLNFCVRTDDPVLIRLLRGAQGVSWFDRPELAASVVAAGPTRVVVSRMARIEITNPIPPPGGVSPDGPHTHVLPDLIKLGRTHNASIPVPAGFLPCLTLYPAHPARDAEGRERPFDAHQHASYQRLLERYGDPDFVAAKRDSDPKAAARSRQESLGRLIAARQRAFAGQAPLTPRKEVIP